MTCFCSRCVPNSFRDVCSACGEEIRLGWRDGVKGFWHRENVDHIPVHGHRSYPERGASWEPEEVVAVPAVEVRAHDVDPADFAPRSGIRQVLKLIDKTEGWELVNCQHARGPYLGSKGEALSVSDSHVVRARALRLDGSVDVVVGSWRDGKFDFAFVGTFKDGLLDSQKADSTAMKNWIKNEGSDRA